MSASISRIYLRSGYFLVLYNLYQQSRALRLFEGIYHKGLFFVTMNARNVCRKTQLILIDMLKPYCKGNLYEIYITDKTLICKQKTIQVISPTKNIHCCIFTEIVLQRYSQSVMSIWFIVRQICLLGPHHFSCPVSSFQCVSENALVFREPHYKLHLGQLKCQAQIRGIRT